MLQVERTDEVRDRAMRKRERQEHSALLAGPCGSGQFPPRGLRFFIHSAHVTWGHLPRLDSVNLSHFPAGPSRRGMLGVLTGTPEGTEQRDCLLCSPYPSHVTSSATPASFLPIQTRLGRCLSGKRYGLVQGKTERKN